MSDCKARSLTHHTLDRWLGAVTPALLVTLVTIHQLECALDQLGQLSETLFQGEALPILDPPTTTPSTPTNPLS